MILFSFLRCFFSFCILCAVVSRLLITDCSFGFLSHLFDWTDKDYIYFFYVNSCSWLYGSWMHMQQVPITLKLWVRIPFQRGVPCTTLCDKVCQFLATCRWFSPVSSTNKSDRHDIAEILLKVALNTITLTPHFTSVVDQQQLSYHSMLPSDMTTLGGNM